MAKADKPKSETKVEAEAPAVRTYLVALGPTGTHPEVPVQAFDRLEAIEKYKALAGILSTIHPIDVREAE